MALTKIGKEGITGISNSSDANAITINSSENVGIGTSSPSDKLHVYQNAADNVLVKLENATTNAGNLVQFSQVTDGSVAAPTFYIGQGGDSTGDAVLINTSNTNMKFSTNNAERMRITAGGNLNVGKTADGIGTAGLALRGDVDVAQFTRSGGEALEINRLADDGNLVIFYQAGTAEGNISVSGTTVSYNGGHLARWSQATDGNRITGLVKGTVMTNLDQMAVWTKDGVTEDNEQLNCMAVSSVEGDANVAGVFVNYDDDDTDYTADMNIAMTGDMVIRIASGTTVARGDLLMSAGDGTAKPQGDDIVRSKTIAKVTSITVSHTYDDGSYLVPCVLMAC